MLKVSIVGCGTIGSALAEAIEEKFKDKISLIALCDIDHNKTGILASKLKMPLQILTLDELIPISDLIIEAASFRIVPELVKKCLTNGKDAMVISIGGLIGQDELFELAEKSKGSLYLPSGALCGLDGIKAAAEAKIKSVELITRKPPLGLKGAPYLKDNNIDVNSIKGETLIFEGSAREAIKGFPKNVNVAALLSIVGLGPKKTMVKIISSPEYKRNSHHIIVEGDFGKIETKTDNLPSPGNPKTSYLAILSCISRLRQIVAHVKVGS